MVAVLFGLIIGIPVCAFIAVESGRPLYGWGAFFGIGLCVLALGMGT